MKNLINNKILILFTIFAVILGFGSNVFANYDFTYNETNYSLPDLPEFSTNDFYFYITSDNDKSFNLVIFNKDDLNSLYFMQDGSYFYIKSKTGSSSLHLYTYYSWKSFLWEDKEIKTFSTGWSVSGFPIYSSIDLKNNNNEVVFQGAPQVKVAETILVPVVEQVEMNKVTQEIVDILPVILITLVSIIAIWKAVNYLRNVLKTS